MTTAIEGINSKLNKDLKELAKTWQAEDRDYKAWDIESDDIVDRGRDEYCKGQL